MEQKQRRSTDLIASFDWLKRLADDGDTDAKKAYTAFAAQLADDLHAILTVTADLEHAGVELKFSERLRTAGKLRT